MEAALEVEIAQIQLLQMVAPVAPPSQHMAQLSMILGTTELNTKQNLVIAHQVSKIFLTLAKPVLFTGGCLFQGLLLGNKNRLFPYLHQLFFLWVLNSFPTTNA